MFLLVAGAALLALGLMSGTILVLAPLGLTPASAEATLWVLFPLCSILGFARFVIGGKTAHIPGFPVMVAGVTGAIGAASQRPADAQT